MKLALTVLTFLTELVLTAHAHTYTHSKGVTIAVVGRGSDG